MFKAIWYYLTHSASERSGLAVIREQAKANRATVSPAKPSEPTISVVVRAEPS